MHKKKKICQDAANHVARRKEKAFSDSSNASRRAASQLGRTRPTTASRRRDGRAPAEKAFSLLHDGCFLYLRQLKSPFLFYTTASSCTYATKWLSPFLFYATASSCTYATKWLRKSKKKSKTSKMTKKKGKNIMTLGHIYRAQNQYKLTENCPPNTSVPRAPQNQLCAV